VCGSKCILIDFVSKVYF